MYSTIRSNDTDKGTIITAMVQQRPFLLILFTRDPKLGKNVTLNKNCEETTRKRGPPKEALKIKETQIHSIATETRHTASSLV